jgi:SOS-response transcriptional repressor LexA
MKMTDQNTMPPFYNMTQPQRDIMLFIVGNIQEQGQSPTIQEISTAVGREPSNVIKTLRLLEARGFIKREAGVVRGITLPEAAK